MSDYGTMQSRIATELERSDLTSEIQDAIQSAISHYERETFWFNEARATANTTATENYIALPSDYMNDLDMVLLDGSIVYDMKRRAFEYIENIDINSYSGRPFDWAIFDNQIRLYPTPDAAYTLRISYTQSLSALSASGDTNAWMTDGEALIRSRAKADIECHVLFDDNAKAEMRGLALNGKDQLCVRELQAYNSLVRRQTRMASTGCLQAYYL